MSREVVRLLIEYISLTSLQMLKGAVTSMQHCLSLLLRSLSFRLSHVASSSETEVESLLSRSTGVAAPLEDETVMKRLPPLRRVSLLRTAIRRHWILRLLAR